MAESQFLFSLQTPIAELYKASVDSVHVATDEGEMEVLPTHASLIGTIQFSKVKVKSGEKVDEFLIRHGVLTVEPEGKTVRLLAQDAQRQSDMQLKSLEDYRAFILERLANPERLSKYQVKFLEEQKSSLEKGMEIVKSQG